MSVQQVADAWSQRGTDYAESAPHKFGPSLPKLLELARPLSTDVCLDVGTGTGHTAAALAPFVKKVCGLDPAEGMLAAARAAYGHLDNLEFVPGTSEDTGFENDAFDIVTARHTLHHHPNIPKTLAELGRVLKPGGRLVIVDEITPDASVEAWYHALEVSRDPTHGRAYLMEAWRAFVEEAGLEWIVGDAHTVYTLDVESWITRMKPTSKAAEKVRTLFREANEGARARFNIVYKNDNAVTFDMPMALILAVKPGR